MKAIPVLVFMVAFSIVMSGCASSPNPIPATSTPTPIPATSTPASTPTESFVLVSSAEPLIGNWYCPQTGYIRFNADGTMDMADAVQFLDTPYTIQQFWFEGAQMLIREIYLAPNLPHCTTDGAYEVRLFEGGSIHLSGENDHCTTRAYSTVGTYKPVP